MHDLEFADSVWQRQRTILRVPLLAYSVGHELLLQRSRNPLVLRSEIPSEPNAHVMQAVSICSRDWAANHQSERWLGLWAWTLRKADFTQAVREFIQYRNEGTLGPNVQPADGDGRSLGGPFMARLIQFILRFTDQPYDFPFGLAMFHYYAYEESQGSIRIVNQQEADFEQYCAEQDAIEAQKARAA